MLLYSSNCTYVKIQIIFILKGQIIYILNPLSKKPLYLQLYDAIKNDIVSHYTIGQKLHSIRKVASLYNLSKNTVESAYAQLYAEGYIDSRAKSGYYVSELFFDTFKESESSATNRAEIKPSSPTLKEERSNKSYRYDFFPAQLHTKDFPLKLWKRLYSKVVNTEADFGSYSDGQGILELRKEIATYLQDSRGVICCAENIIITHGFIDSMELIAKFGRERYKIFAQEIPGYHIAHKVFGSYGYEVQNIGVDENGLNIEELMQSDAEVLYITPSHQYPTGATMPVENRLKIIQLMQERGGLIIEDDYDSELTYYNRPIPSLQGLDDKGESVAYLGTFAKALSPTLRVGYMVMPSWFMEAYKKSYDAHFSRVSLTTQLTLSAFMREGHWSSQIRRARILNKRKHKVMKNSLNRYLGSSFKIIAEGAGLAILIVPVKPHFDWEKLKRVAEEENIAIYLSKERSGGEFEAIRMGFGGFKIDEIDEAIAAFSRVWSKANEVQ